jgi:hypothetical protein
VTTFTTSSPRNKFFNEIKRRVYERGVPPNLATLKGHIRKDLRDPQGLKWLASTFARENASCGRCKRMVNKILKVQ